MKHFAFIKLLPRFVEKLNFNGITFQPTKHIADIVLYNNETYSVPVFRIINSKNIPFSYNSLKDLVTTELEETLKPITSSKLTNYEIDKLVVFDDFSRNDFYIPNNIISQFKNCVDGLEHQFTYRKVNKIYTIKYKNIIDNNFDLYWEDRETFKIDMSIEVESIFFEDLSTNGFLFLPKNEIAEVFDDIYYRVPEQFEDGIWPCIQNHLSKYKTLVNPEWQYYYYNVIFKENLT